MSVVRTNTDWFQADLVSAREGNLTPLAFFDLFKLMYKAYRPEVQVLLHGEKDTGEHSPYLTMEIRQRRPIQTDKRRPANDRVGSDMHHVFTLMDRYNDLGWQYYFQLFEHTFRFRTFGQSIAQAEAEAIGLERFFRDYERFFRYAGVQHVDFVDGSSKDLDRSSREAVSYAIRDYRVMLKEITIERQAPLSLVEISVRSGYQTVTETIDAVRYAESAGELAHQPLYVIDVYQGNYSMVEGVDYAVTETGISWATDPPLPYHVIYRYGVTRGVVEVERPFQQVRARS